MSEASGVCYMAKFRLWEMCNAENEWPSAKKRRFGVLFLSSWEYTRDVRLMLSLIIVRLLLVMCLKCLTTLVGSGAFRRLVKCVSRCMPAMGTTLGTTGTAILVVRVVLMR